MKTIFDGKIVVEFTKEELYMLKQIVLGVMASDDYEDYTDAAKEVLENIRKL